jgi:hypothetical protein
MFTNPECSVFHFGFDDFPTVRFLMFLLTAQYLRFVSFHTWTWFWNSPLDGFENFKQGKDECWSHLRKIFFLERSVKLR